VKAPNRTHRDPTPRRKENAQLSMKVYEVEIFYFCDKTSSCRGPIPPNLKQWLKYK